MARDDRHHDGYDDDDVICFGFFCLLANWPLFPRS